MTRYLATIARLRPEVHVSVHCLRRQALEPIWNQPIRVCARAQPHGQPRSRSAFTLAAAVGGARSGPPPSWKRPESVLHDVGEAATSRPSPTRYPSALPSSSDSLRVPLSSPPTESSTDHRHGDDVRESPNRVDAVKNLHILLDQNRKISATLRTSPAAGWLDDPDGPQCVGAEWTESPARSIGYRPGGGPSCPLLSRE